MDFRSSFVGRLAHLDADVSAAALTTVGPDWREDWFVPSYNKCYFFLDGRGTVGIDGKDYSPRPGDLFLMRAGVRQRFSTDPGLPFTKYWCHFWANVGGKNLLDLVDIPPMMRVGDIEALSAVFKRLVDHYAGTSVSSYLHRKSALIELLAACLELAGCEGDMQAFDPEDPMQWVYGYIEENLSRELDVASLARVAKLQPSYFSEKFRKVFGLPPMRYVLLRRTEAAKRLLSQTRTSVSEIADRLGYSDLYQFSRSFKEQTGFSPSIWRGMNAGL
jgi:AraC family transcriptional regulator, arabinose operon regulatory protein